MAALRVTPMVGGYNQWVAMEPVERSRVMDSLLDLRRHGEALLAALPIDLRREWERKLG